MLMADGRGARSHISATQAAVKEPTPAPASKRRMLGLVTDAIEAISLAVADGVKNCPSSERRPASSLRAAPMR